MNWGKKMSHKATVLMGFLTEGDVIKGLDVRTVERSEGQIGVMSIFAHYAECIAEFVEKQDVDFPGVFEYEVVPGLGVWAVGNSLPGVDKFRDELQKRFTDWIGDAK